MVKTSEYAGVYHYLHSPSYFYTHLYVHEICINSVRSNGAALHMQYIYVHIV